MLIITKAIRLVGGYTLKLGYFSHITNLLTNELVCTRKVGFMLLLGKKKFLPSPGFEPTSFKPRSFFTATLF